MPIAAYAATTAVRGRRGFAAIFRFVIVPMFLFSGTFFPVSQLPLVLRAAGLRDADLARRRALPQARRSATIELAAGRSVHAAYLARAGRSSGFVLARRAYRERLLG